ncbi:MAG: ECF transporter S component [Thaumarchaeota archaeon]|nr:ECF transporter S component [Nitrososphaerota archaeon]
MVDAKTIASTAVFTAFVAAATSVFSVYIPATTGYFNVGEVMVYTCALLMGRYVGAFAGGVGSMLADISLGYPYFAPGTLVIKGVEGFIVGFLGQKTLQKVTRAQWRALTVASGVLFALALGYIGTAYLSGEFSPTLGGAWYIPALTLDFQVPPLFWVGLSILSFALILYSGLRAEANVGLAVLAVLAGGAAMVAGYYAYESFVIGLIAPSEVVASVAPAAEVPFNVAQALIGLTVAVPLVRSVRRVAWRQQGLGSVPSEDRMT